MLLQDRVRLPTKRTYTDEGFLIAPATISRSGIQEYYAIELGLKDRNATDLIRLYRPKEEVFAQESLDSFSNKPVTDGHPPEMVTAENIKKYQVGHSDATISVEGTFVKTVIHVTDVKAIKQIEDGKVELSNGYTSDIDWTAGTSPEGEQYDAIQRNIKGNHIALVTKGRCGSACKVSDNTPTHIGKSMKTITIDGVDFEVSEQAAQAIAKVQARCQDAEKETDKEKKEKDKKEDEKEEMKKDHTKALDALQAKLDDAVTKSPTPAMLDQLVENRLVTRDVAKKLVPDLDFKDKDCEVVRKEVVLKLCDGVDGEAVSAEYIKARFDALAESSKGTSTLDNDLGQSVSKDLKDESVADKDSPAAHRQAMIDRNKNAWNKNAKTGSDK